MARAFRFLSPVAGALAALVLLGCELAAPAPKQEPGLVLPAATAVGANTLGFEIDGCVWVNYGRDCSLISGVCSGNVVRVASGPRRGGPYLALSAVLFTPQRQETFFLSLDTLRGAGIYRAGPPPVPLPPGMAGTGPNGLMLHDARPGPAGFLYFSRANATRIVVTRLDTVRRIAAGTFEGQLEDALNPGTVAEIRNGRFDVTY